MFWDLLQTLQALSCWRGTANATSAVNHHWFLFVRITQTQGLWRHLSKGLTLGTFCTFEMTNIPFLIIFGDSKQNCNDDGLVAGIPMHTRLEVPHVFSGPRDLQLSNIPETYCGYLWLFPVQAKISKCSSGCYTCNPPCFETSVSQDGVS